jgi:hypothetical protein
VYDQIKTQLDAISELSDEQVAELQADIISQFEAVEGEDPTPETVDAMTSLADSLDIVRGELSNREAMAAELAAKAAEATARVKGEGYGDEGEEMAMTEDEPMDKEEDEMDEAPADSDSETEEVEPMEESEEEEEKEDEMSIQASAENEATSEEVTAEATIEADATTEASVEEEAIVEDAAPEAELSVEAEEVVETPAEEAVVESSVETEASVEETAEVETPEAELSADDQVEAEAVAEVVEDSASEASTDQEDGSELSTETEEVTELSTDEAAEAVVEVETEAELSSDETIETSTALVEEQKEQALVSAAEEQPFEAPADRQPVVQVTEVPVAITAGADIPGYTAGSNIEDMDEVSRAMEKRLHSLRRVNGGDGEQHIVASFTTQYPEERFLGTDAESNADKIEAVVGQDALVASGGHAAPVEVKYDIYGVGSTTVRPVRDALPRFQADRGGIRFVTPPSFAAGTYANAVGVWTAATDEAPYSNTKTSYTVTAAAENTVSTDAVTLQLQFGNLMTRAYPELIARHNELALVQHAREAEQNLLTNIGSGSTAVTSSSLIGFGRDFLVQLRRAATAYRSRHRLSPDAVLKAIIPSWVYDAMAADLTLSMPGDGTLSVSQAEINGYLASINVDLVASPDATPFGAQSTGAMVEFPDSFVWYLFAEGTFLFLDGGTLDLGIIRDSTLVGTNDYKMFVETFENVAKVGIESLAITSTISVNGVAAALRDTTGGATAAAIEL